MEQFTISTELNKSAKEVYAAWLDAEKHSAFTGGEAAISSEINSIFTAWDEYITGRILELEEGKRILQTWRTIEFEEDAKDSLLEVLFEELENGSCKIILNHSQLPTGGEKKYSIGWEENYFEPMRDYFES